MSRSSGPGLNIQTLHAWAGTSLVPDKLLSLRSWLRPVGAKDTSRFNSRKLGKDMSAFLSQAWKLSLLGL